MTTKDGLCLIPVFCFVTLLTKTSCFVSVNISEGGHCLIDYLSFDHWSAHKALLFPIYLDCAHVIKGTNQLSGAFAFIGAKSSKGLCLVRNSAWSSRIWDIAALHFYNWKHLFIPMGITKGLSNKIGD